MNFPYTKGRIKRFARKYWGLACLAWDELKIGGLGGVIFAVRRHFKKRKGEWKGGYPAADDFEENLVTIAILSKDRIDLLKPCLESIEAILSQKYEVEILIGDTGSRKWGTWKFYREAKKKWKNFRVVKFRYYFFSKNYNKLIENYAKGQYVILLNNDTIVRGGWIDALVDPLQNKRIGVVGGKLLYKNETIQHAGVEFDEKESAAHVFREKPKDFPEANYKAYVPSATFACVAMRHDVYNRFRLSEEFKEESQDPDFCLRLQEAGFRILYNPECEIFHLECSTRDWRKGEADRQLLRKKWGKRIKEIYENGITSLSLRAQRSNPGIAAVSRRGGIPRNDKSGVQRVEFDPDEYKNSITVIRDDGIGDLLMGMSAFKKLREENPGKKLILATYERNIEMMAGFGIFDEFISIPDGKKYSPLPIPGDSKVFNFIDLEMEFGPIWGNAKEDNKINRHYIYSRRLGLDEKFELVPMPDYSEARKRVERILDRENQPFVVFNLIASNPARSWWGPYYPELIKAVEDMGFTPLVLGTKDSRYYTGEKVINLVGKTKTITEFIEAVKLGEYVISTDTSAYHIAALSGIPFLAIFTGGMTPESRLNLYKKYEALTPPKSLKCYPCWDEGCKDLSVRWKKDPCRLAIKPEEAIEKFKKLVEKYPK